MTFAALSQIDAASTWGQGGSATRKSDLGRDEFMQLLVTQLQNQDPLNPADAQEFASQLAQFSSLEQLINMNSTLASVNDLQASINNAQAASFIGHNVLAYGRNAIVREGQASNLQFDLTDGAASVRVDIYNKDGNLVRTDKLGAIGSGPYTYEWNGKDDNGSPLPDGSYTYSVTAETADKNIVTVNTYTTGKVEGVLFERGITYLKVNGSHLTLSDIVEIYD